MIYKTVALLAHNSRKEDLVLLVKSHQNDLQSFNLISTRDTGQLIHARTGLPVTLLLHGSQGGDQQIGALVAGEEIDGVIFLRDPLNVQTGEPDVSGLLKVCDVHNVPLATNSATAEAVVQWLIFNKAISQSHNEAAQFLEEIASEHN